MMATRNHGAGIRQQKEAAMAKQKAAAVPVDARNRKALEDIGNLANLRIADGKAITRPITRSFGAQLLANAQAAVVAANKKNMLKHGGGGLLADGDGKKKPASKNPKPEVVVKDISPVAEPKEKHSKDRPHASFSKRKVHSLTSVLTARSKMACGIQDIDASDIENEFSMVEYVEDLYKFYKHQEKLCLPRDYISSHAEINPKIRGIVVDWLIEVHYRFGLTPETLFLATFIFDRFLSMESKPVRREELQLLGISSLLIASKYEEIWAPEVSELITISHGAYTRDQILAMEKAVLNKLDWSLTFPTPYVFIVRFLKAAAASDKEMEHLAFFFAELSLTQYSMILHCPSMVAASAVYAASCTLNRSPPWSKTLEYHAGFTEKQLMECAKLMVGFHLSAPESKLCVVYRKYSKEERGRVACKPPAAKFTDFGGDCSSIAETLTNNAN